MEKCDLVEDYKNMKGPGNTKEKTNKLILTIIDLVKLSILGLSCL